MDSRARTAGGGANGAGRIGFGGIGIRPARAPHGEPPLISPRDFVFLNAPVFTGAFFLLESLNSWFGIPHLRGPAEVGTPNILRAARCVKIGIAFNADFAGIFRFVEQEITMPVARPGSLVCSC